MFYLIKIVLELGEFIIKMKTYTVSVDIKWSEDYVIKAKTKAEAKSKAIDRFRNKKGNFEADAEVFEDY